jgi:AcrR family transcriptional regulator
VPAADRRLKPSKEPRQRRSRETRDRLLAAAARVFAERGYAGGTTNHVAAEAGLSVGSLYQYFPNKDAMLAELMRAHVAEGTGRVVARFGDAVPAGGSVAEALRPFVDAAIDAHRGDPDLHRVLFEEAPRPPDVLAELHDLEDAAVGVTAALLHASPAVRVPDPDLAAWFVVAAIESLTHRYIGSHRGELDLDAFGDELVRLLAAYLEG